MFIDGVRVNSISSVVTYSGYKACEEGGREKWEPIWLGKLPNGEKILTSQVLICQLIVATLL